MRTTISIGLVMLAIVLLSVDDVGARGGRGGGGVAEAVAAEECRVAG